MASNQPLQVPWPYLDSHQPADASEFSWGYGLEPPGYEKISPEFGGRYQGTIAGETLEHALPEGIPNDG